MRIYETLTACCWNSYGQAVPINDQLPFAAGAVRPISILTANTLPFQLHVKSIRKTLLCYRQDWEFAE